MTAQGHPRAIFKRAIEHGNVLAVEMAAWEMGVVTIAESLTLVALVVQKDPGRRARYAVRWLRRLLEKDANLSIRGGGSRCVGPGCARRPDARRVVLDAFGHG